MNDYMDQKGEKMKNSVITVTDIENDYLSDTYAYTIKGFTIFLSLKQR